MSARVDEILAALRAAVLPRLRGRPVIDAAEIRAVVLEVLPELLRDEERANIGDLGVLVDECLRTLWEKGGPAS